MPFGLLILFSIVVAAAAYEEQTAYTRSNDSRVSNTIGFRNIHAYTRPSEFG